MAVYFVQSLTLAIMASQCALYGLYLAFFALALWTTHKGDSVFSRTQRAVTIIIFVLVTTHILLWIIFNSRPVLAGERDPQNLNTYSEYPSDIPRSDALQATAHAVTVLVGLLSDAILAWRFCAIHNKKPWTVYLSAFVLLCDLGLGVTAGAHTVYDWHHPHYDRGLGSEVAYTWQYPETGERFTTIGGYNTIYGSDTYGIIWAWVLFASNTALTALIILQIARKAASDNTISLENLRSLLRHRLIIEAIVESALVSWTGLLIYAISISARKPPYYPPVIYVTYAILPYFFGISQCLITVRLGLARTAGPARAMAARHDTASLLGRRAPPVFLSGNEVDTTRVCETYDQGATVTPFIMTDETQIPSPSPDNHSKDGLDPAAREIIQLEKVTVR